MSGTPIDRKEQQRQASAAYREKMRSVLAAASKKGAVVLDPDQAAALRDGLAELSAAVDAHAQALDDWAAEDTDATSNELFDTRLALAETTENVMLGWAEALPDDLLPDQS